MNRPSCGTGSVGCAEVRTKSRKAATRCWGTLGVSYVERRNAVVSLRHLPPLIPLSPLPLPPPLGTLLVRPLLRRLQRPPDKLPSPPPSPPRLFPSASRLESPMTPSDGTTR